MNAWSNDDIDSLIKMYNDGVKQKEIAIQLGRSFKSVDSKIFNLQKNGEMEKRLIRKVTKPKIFVFDIETSTFTARLFSPKVNYVSHKNIIEDWFVICWAGRWQGEKRIRHDVVTPEEAKNRDDKRVCASLWEIMNEADVLIAHNGDRFDIKKMNYRFCIKHGFNPPLPYRTIDTLKESRKIFASTSHALDYLAKQLKIPAKISTGFQLWIDCENGVKAALQEMDYYCRHDIEIGEEMYLVIRPWMKTGVNMGLYTNLNGSVCPRCGSDELIPAAKFVTTAANAYESYRCDGCGHTGRTKKSTLDIEQRRKLVL